MTPQERWLAFRERLPQWTCLQWFVILLIVGLMLGSCTIFILPFVLPLAGETVNAHSLADPDGQFIDIDGHEVYYVHAVGNGEPVILVHGFSEATVTWQAVMPQLQAANFDVYAIDLLGFGLSEKGMNINMSHAAQATLITHWMDELGIQQAHLVGHSMGGNIILHLAMTYPERAKTLTLAAPSLQTANTAEIPADVLNAFFVKRWASVLLRWMLPQTVEIQLKSATEQDQVVTPELVDAYLRTYQTPDWDLSLLALARDSHLNTLPAPLEGLNMPALIIWGEDDSWIPVEDGEKLATQLPNAQLITLSNMGHLPMHEAPNEFSRALISFLHPD